MAIKLLHKVLGIKPYKPNKILTVQPPIGGIIKMGKVADMSQFMRDQVPVMDKQADDTRARMEAVKARHDDLMAKMAAKLDERDKELSDMQAMLDQMA